MNHVMDRLALFARWFLRTHDLRRPRSLVRLINDEAEYSVIWQAHALTRHHVITATGSRGRHGRHGQNLGCGV